MYMSRVNELTACSYSDPNDAAHATNNKKMQPACMHGRDGTISVHCKCMC